MSRRMNLAPLRFAIGMMEKWNDGIMGCGLRPESLPGCKRLRGEEWQNGSLGKFLSAKKLKMFISLRIPY
jgi:hypothetical protein